ncbi:MAG: HNH endonuclease [Bacteriovoracia bacterium]
MDLRKFSDDQLLESTWQLARAERRLVTALLHHLNEIALRRLYAKESYPSLFEYCVRVLRFSESQAQRRICAARLMREFPEMEEKLQKGDLTLSAAGQAQVFFHKKKLPREKRIEILMQIENKSARDIQKILRSLDPTNFRELVRPISNSHTEIRFAATRELFQKLERLKEIFAAKSIEQLVEKLADVALQKYDPIKKAERNLRVAKRRNASITSQVNPHPKHSRHIPAQVRHAVWLRDQALCTYPSCGSQFSLQLDHVIPFAKGGLNTVENLRLRCPAHNQLHALEEFGEKKMSEHWKS